MRVCFGKYCFAIAKYKYSVEEKVKMININCDLFRFKNVTCDMLQYVYEDVLTI